MHKHFLRCKKLWLYVLAYQIGLRWMKRRIQCSVVPINLDFTILFGYLPTTRNAIGVP
jgi:hypothetical protein